MTSSVAVLRSAQMHRLPGSLAPGGDQAEQADLMVLWARGLDDAGTVISTVRRNGVVVLNCARMGAQAAQRLIDLVSGGVLAMDGQTRRISGDVLLCCPAITRIET